MKIPSVQKIRKPVLIVGIAVAMACLLFPFGDTTHQAHAAPKDTQSLTVNMDDVISVLDAQRTQTAQSLLTLNAYGTGNSYYTQVADDYDSNIQSEVDLWLSHLATQAQNNGSLNSDPNDQSIIINAMTESYRLNDWASYVATSIRSGSGIVPLEDFHIDSDALLEGTLKVFTKVLSDSISNCLQKIWAIEAWYPSGRTLRDAISGQPVPRPQAECGLYP